ncbi:YibE/F family protein [Candidatus Dojkabacteria bacterium]|nr:YibE/F family protein [Candidatus Dojkabacteria bacterium]
MKNSILKYFIKKKGDIFSILLFLLIIFLAWVFIPKIPLLKREGQVVKYIDPIYVTVADVKQNTVTEIDVKQNEIEMLEDTIGFYLPNGEYREITLSHLSDDYRVREGDHIIVYSFDDQTYFYHDINRVYYLKYLIILFIIIVALIGGILGVKALLSLGFSCVILILGLIPLLEKGYDPILVIIGIGFLIISSSLFFLYGFKKRTLIALLGTSIGLFLSSLLSLLYVDLLRLTGIQDEIDSFLYSYSPVNFNMKNLLTGSFILGTLGVIDDVTISQVITVEEIYNNAKNISTKELFLSAMKIGRSHIASMVNTLFLAYFSVSLSLILVVSMQNWDINLLLNKRFIATEIVRTLVGSMGLVVSVPITTYLSCIAPKKTILKKPTKYLLKLFQKA